MFRRSFLQKTALTFAGISTGTSLLSARATSLYTLPFPIQKHLENWQTQMNPDQKTHLQKHIVNYTTPAKILNNSVSENGYNFTYLNKYGTKIELTSQQGRLKTVTM